MTAHSPAEIIARLESLLEDKTVSQDYVRLRIGLLRAQADTLAALADEPCAEAAQRDIRHVPMLRPEEIRFDRALVERLFEAIAAVSERCGNVGEEVARLRSAMHGDPELLDRFPYRTAFEDEIYMTLLGDRLELPAQLLLFWGRLLAAPFVIHAAGRLLPPKLQILEGAFGGDCPVCGSPPALAGLRKDDGKRILYCSLCGYGWPLDRLACPFCADGAEGGLEKLTVKGEQARWIEICPKCKHYLKTIDSRQLADRQEIVPLVEDVVGLYFNLLAEKEGYGCMRPYTAM